MYDDQDEERILSILSSEIEDEKMAADACASLLNLTVMTDSITKFSGDDKAHTASKWAQDIEDNSEIFSWTEAQKLVVARRSLVGTAALWLQSEKTFKKYDELKAALLKEFPDAINTKEMHELMGNRKKRREESYYQYMLIMKELGKRAKFPDYVAIQYIVDGITDYEPNKSILYGATTYPVLKEKLLLYEKMKTKTKKEDKEAKPNKIEKDTKYNSSSSSSSRKRCYKCGEEDHLAVTCSRGVKCYFCNDFGHISRECPSKSKERGGGGGAGAAGGADSSVKQSRISGAGEKARQQASPSVKQSAAVDIRRQSAMFGILANEEADVNMADDSVDSYRHDVNIATKVDESKTKTNKKKPMKLINLCGVEIQALVDSGSGFNLINKDSFDELKVKMCDDDSVFTGLGMKDIFPYGKFYANMIIDETCYDDTIFHVVPNDCMPYKCIVGREFLDTVTMVMCKGSVKFLPLEDEGWLARLDCVCEVFTVSDHVRDGTVREEVERLVAEYNPVQTREAPIELKIILKDDVPVAQRPRRLSIVEQNIVEEQVNEWMQKGIIQPRRSKRRY
ncbi:uncharacterized protein LOC134653310 [Cydia amplana]|uniref:uncharacterized protein LOC134653310 n=1 Tax=Cydia amplana TaxID=1869771 RepID=UPI002FE67362